MVIVRFNDVWPGGALDDDRQAEGDDRARSGEPEIDADADQRRRRRCHRRVLDNGERLRSRQHAAFSHRPVGPFY